MFTVILVGHGSLDRLLIGSLDRLWRLLPVWAKCSVAARACLALPQAVDLSPSWGCSASTKATDKGYLVCKS
jgi:hypothetical protein